MSGTVLSCVCDGTPAIAMQTWNWLCSLRALGSGARARIVVHCTPTVPDGHARVFEALGAEIVPIEPFGGGSGHCNKIVQLASGALDGADHAVLCDADIVHRACPAALVVGDAVRGKIVDGPNPPAAMLRALAVEAGLEGRFVPLDGAEGEATLSSNFNGGLYVLPAHAVAALAEPWERWARWCVARADALGRFAVHADQIAFALALVETGLEHEALPVAANFPTHLPPARLDALGPVEIEALHYHRRMDDHGLPAPTGVAWIDRQIGQVNAALREVRREGFDNAIFWDYRYRSAPELGSGRGSRGEVLAQKRLMLAPVAWAFRDAEVLDVGCGDIETVRHLPLRHYTGLDASAEALETARAKRPAWRYRRGAADALEPRSCELALCLDVLIHQPTREAFDGLLDAVIGAARSAVVVSGYDEPPAGRGIVFHHEPLRGALERRDRVREVLPLGAYHGASVYLAVLEGPDERRRADMDVAGMVDGFRATGDSALLADLVALSRERLGFFPRTAARAVEYPWLAGRLGALEGHGVIDLGAGVCALPLWLAARGVVVTTLDNHGTARDPSDRSRWNEWGWLDYAALDPRIRSIRADAAGHVPDERVAAVYSASVVEHMPAVIRARVLTRAADWLLPGGRLLLTLDLMPGTADLWTLSEGREVDEPGTHGTLADVLDELRGAGLRVAEVSLRRDVPRSRSDLAFMEAVRD